MAIAFTAAETDRLRRSSDLLDFNAPYTVMAWVQTTASTGAFQMFWSLAFDNHEMHDWVGRSTAGLFNLGVSNGGGAAGVTGSALSLSTWYHITVVRSSTTLLTAYLNGVSDITNSGSVVGRTTNDTFILGEAADSGDDFTGQVAGLKAWAVALSVEEIQAEMLSIRPRAFASLYGFWPFLTNDIADYSGNGRSWTLTGVVDSVDNPPVSWGASPTIVMRDGGDGVTLIFPVVGRTGLIAPQQRYPRR